VVVVPLFVWLGGSDGSGCGGSSRYTSPSPSRSPLTRYLFPVNQERTKIQVVFYCVAAAGFAPITHTGASSFSSFSSSAFLSLPSLPSSSEGFFEEGVSALRSLHTNPSFGCCCCCPSSVAVAGAAGVWVVVASSPKRASEEDLLSASSAAWSLVTVAVARGVVSVVVVLDLKPSVVAALLASAAGSGRTQHMAAGVVVVWSDILRYGVWFGLVE
ncbi:hypothetical protein F5Y08DRAFT_323809, partial [Xylaria arbuscula]